MWSEKGDVVFSNERNSCDPDLCKTKSASICLQSRCSIEAILSLLNFDIFKNSHESVSSPKSIWGPFIAPKGEKRPSACMALLCAKTIISSPFYCYGNSLDHFSYQGPKNNSLISLFSNTSYSHNQFL